MRLRIDPDARVPASAQLRDQLAARIVSGRLAPGSRLPPTRELAERLGLAPNTVAKAYRALEASGHLVARGRHGTFVAEILPTPPDDVNGRLREAAAAFAARTRQLGVPPSRALSAVRRELTARRPRARRGSRR